MRVFYFFNHYRHPVDMRNDRDEFTRTGSIYVSAQRTLYWIPALKPCSAKAKQRGGDDKEVILT